MLEARYPAARAVAPVLQAHFARHLAAAAAGPGTAALPDVPDASAIEALIDAAFLASLRRAESYLARLSLALLAPTGTQRPLVVVRPPPLVPDALVRIVP